MPTRLTVTAGVLVEAGQEQVWSLAVDWPRQREWIWATRTEGGSGVGAAVTGRTGVGPVCFTDSMVITAWEPPRRCVVAHTGRVVRGDGEFEVRPRGDCSEFVWTERIVLPWPPARSASRRTLPAALARLATTVVGRLARLGLGWSLGRFARLVARS